VKIPPIKRYLAIALIAYQKREINANLGGIFKPVLGEWAVKSLAPWGSERERQTGIYPAIIGGRGGIPMMRHFDAIKGLRPCMRGISSLIGKSSTIVEVTPMYARDQCRQGVRNSPR